LTLSILVEGSLYDHLCLQLSGTKEVIIKELDYSSVLNAIVKYLNESQLNTCADNIDRTMFTNNGPTFTLYTSKGSFKDCKLDIVRNPFGC